MSIKDVVREWDRAVIEQVVEHGCIMGCVPGLIYYVDTEAFHDKHECEIWDMLYEDALAADLTPMQLIASFNGQRDVGSMQQLKNLLTCYAVERICGEIINEG